MNRSLNLKDPKDFDEKVEWLKLHADLTEWTRLADKYEVRKYIEECGLGHILVKLYGAWDRAEDIDFSTLPDKFVLKTNHGFGKTLIVQDKAYLDVEHTRKLLNKWVGERYGLLTFEPHYWHIRRRIIAEELLEDQVNANISAALIDYKFFCIHGEPEAIMVLYNRQNMVVGKEESKERDYARCVICDIDWTPMPEKSSETIHRGEDGLVPRPVNLEEMVRVCRILSKPFAQVRVDLYEVNGHLYFGELTFTPGAMNRTLTSDYCLELGSKIDLSTVKRRKSLFIV